jgi:hypothetical protein
MKWCSVRIIYIFAHFNTLLISNILYKFIVDNIKVREHRRGNHQLTIQRNWQRRTHKTKKTKQLFTITEHPSSPPVFSGVRVTRSLVLCACFVDCCLSFFPFSFGHCVVCSSSINGFWLPLWYRQALHMNTTYDLPHSRRSC